MNLCLALLGIVSLAGAGVIVPLRKRVTLLEQIVATHVEVSRETLEVLKQIRGEE